MFERTPSDMTTWVRNFRMTMITTVVQLSQTFSQADIDQRVLIDVDDKGNIVGILTLFLEFPEMMRIGGMPDGEMVPIGRMTARNWATMRM